MHDLDKCSTLSVKINIKKYVAISIIYNKSKN